MKLWLRLIFCFGCSLPAFARLGETEAQCSQRYGEEISVTDAGQARSIEYIKDDYVIVATFLNGISVCEAYRKNGSVPLSDSEAVEILSKNGCGNWQIVSDNQPGKHWAPTPEASEPGASLRMGTLVVWTNGGRAALAILKDFNEKENQADAQTKARQATSGL
jgi:hypothetical protein